VAIQDRIYSTGDGERWDRNKLGMLCRKC